MTRGAFRRKVLFERWLESDGDLTYAEWLDSLRARRERLRQQRTLDAAMQRQYAAMQGMMQSPLNALHQMGGVGSEIERLSQLLGGPLGGLFGASHW